MAGDIGQNKALCDQLAEDRQPTAAIELGTDAKCLQPVMAESEDALGFGAEQQIHQMPRTETLPGAVNRGKRFLGGDCSVPARDRHAAIVAIAAGRMIGLPEIAEQHLPAATDRFAIAEQGLDLLPLDTALAIGHLAAVEQPEEARHIGHAVRHPSIGHEPVAPGATGLLVVGFEVLRRVQMGDEADIRLVDTHTEGDRRDNHDAFLPEKAILMTLAYRWVEPCMIRKSVTAARLEPGSGILDRPPSKTIDDPRIARMLGRQKFPELIKRVTLSHHAVEEVRPVVAGGEDARFGQMQLSDDVTPGRPVGGRRERQNRYPEKALLEDGELLIF